MGVPITQRNITLKTASTAYLHLWKPGVRGGLLIYAMERQSQSGNYDYKRIVSGTQPVRYSTELRYYRHALRLFAPHLQELFRFVEREHTSPDGTHLLIHDRAEDLPWEITVKKFSYENSDGDMVSTLHHTDKALQDAETSALILADYLEEHREGYERPVQFLRDLCTPPPVDRPKITRFQVGQMVSFKFYDINLNHNWQIGQLVEYDPHRGYWLVGNERVEIWVTRNDIKALPKEKSWG